MTFIIDRYLKDLYQAEVPYISQLQTSLQENGAFLIKASEWGDPSKAFYIIFPLILAIQRKNGILYLTAAILCEWINQVLKWVLHGHRPYWWIQMNQHQKKELSLRQTPLTCETGPGNPSGHVMINVVTCLAVFSLISDQLQAYDLRMGLVVRRMLKNLLFVWLAIMCTSRVYILAHFPHQCALAICIGYICFNWSKSKLNSWTRSHLCIKVIMALSLLASALFIHENLQTFLGFHPNWSIDMAKKYCAKAEWIYVDTTPLYSMVRYSGSALGLALSNLQLKKKEKMNDWLSILFRIPLFLSIGLASHYIHKNPFIELDMASFYFFEFALNAGTVMLLLLMSNKF